VAAGLTVFLLAQRFAPQGQRAATTVIVLGGSTPAVSTPHRGARFAFDAMRSIRPVMSAGVDPASHAG
jgi:hypothetical protein